MAQDIYFLNFETQDHFSSIFAYFLIISCAGIFSALIFAFPMAFLSLDPKGSGFWSSELSYRIWAGFLNKLSHCKLCDLGQETIT